MPEEEETSASDGYKGKLYTRKSGSSRGTKTRRHSN